MQSPKFRELSLWPVNVELGRHRVGFDVPGSLMFFLPELHIGEFMLMVRMFFHYVRRFWSLGEDPDRQSHMKGSYQGVIPKGHMIDAVI